MASVEKALQMLRNLPRVAIHNIKDLPEQIKMRKKQVKKIRIHNFLYESFN
jgi:hypothetical protein